LQRLAEGREGRGKAPFGHIGWWKSGPGELGDRLIRGDGKVREVRSFETKECPQREAIVDQLRREG
jgi:hypothetical protein